MQSAPPQTHWVPNALALKRVSPERAGSTPRQRRTRINGRRNYRPAALFSTDTAYRIMVGMQGGVGGVGGVGVCR